MQRYVSGKSKIIKINKTLSVKYEKKIETIKIDNVVHKINVQMQENPTNSEKLKDMKLLFLQQGDSIILVIDISKEDSINNLKIWNDLIVKYNKKKVPVFLLPTKYDLIDKNQVKSNRATLSKVCENYKWHLMNYISNLIDDKQNFEDNMKTIIMNTYNNSKKKYDKVLYKTDPKTIDCCLII